MGCPYIIMHYALKIGVEMGLWRAERRVSLEKSLKNYCLFAIKCQIALAKCAKVIYTDRVIL